MARNRKVADKLAGQIYKTDNLNQFKFLKGNRTVNISTKLRKSVSDHGVVTPIKVNKKMEVVDGQHRLALAKELGLPIKYMFDDGDINVAELNSTSRAWNLSDYIHQYATLGYTQFTQLVALMETYPALRLTSTIAQAQGRTNSSSRKNDSIKDGSFVFKNYAEYKKFAKVYQHFIDTTGVRSSLNIQNAYFILYVTTSFDPQRFIKKANSRGLADSLYGVTSLPRILRALIEANNSGLSQKSKNWIGMVTDQLGTLTITTAVNKKLVNEIAGVQAK